MRLSQTNGLTREDKRAAFLVDKDRKAELSQLSDDLAIVSPLVDMRLRDIAPEKKQ